MRELLAGSVLLAQKPAVSLSMVGIDTGADAASLAAASAHKGPSLRWVGDEAKLLLEECFVHRPQRLAVELGCCCGTC